jgi:hypothetical protein
MDAAYFTWGKGSPEKEVENMRLTEMKGDSKLRVHHGFSCSQGWEGTRPSPRDIG